MSTQIEGEKIRFCAFIAAIIIQQYFMWLNLKTICAFVVSTERWW
jgi:hypothetical protein